MTIDNKQAPSQQQQLSQALGLNLPRMLSGQNPFSFCSQRSPEEQRAFLLATIDQALEITADCDDCFFSEEEKSSSLRYGNTSHGDHDEDDRNSQKQ
jgi:hypothetical protein